VFAILYLLFFGFFLIFFLKNIVLAFRFVFNTLFSPASSLGVDYLIWGSIFIICLVVPFFASIFAIFLPLELKKRSWSKTTRILIILLASFLIINFVLISDFSTGFVEKQTPIKTFLELKGISPRF
jgi:hypothetical protein